MASREAVAQGLLILRSFWASMPDSELVVTELADDCREYTDAEFLAGVRRVRSEHESAAPPKPAAIRKACAAIAGVARLSAVQERLGARADAYCQVCGTRELEWSRLWPNGHARMVPRHEHNCPRYDAENVIPAAVRMDRWPGRKPRETTAQVAPTRGLAALANVLSEVTP